MWYSGSQTKKVYHGGESLVLNCCCWVSQVKVLDSFGVIDKLKEKFWSSGGAESEQSWHKSMEERNWRLQVWQLNGERNGVFSRKNGVRFLF